MEVPGPGEYLLYLRFSPYFVIEAGSACVENAGDGDTRLTVEGDGPQTIEVEARFGLDGLLRRSRACS